MNVSFIKGQGTGNDFVLLHDPEGALQLSDDEIRAMCNRHFGIGADGVIIATHTSASAEVRHLLDEEPGALWFMDYRNADGSKGEMCGNGARVFARYLLTGGHASLTDGSTLPIATRAGIKDITATANGFASSQRTDRQRTAADQPLRFEHPCRPRTISQECIR